MPVILHLSPSQAERCINALANSGAEELGNVAPVRGDLESFVPKWKTLMLQDMAFSLGAVEGTRWVGLLFAISMSDLWTRVKQAAMLMWYVPPEFRKSGLALKLLDEFEREARRRGCGRVLGGCWSGYHGKAFRRVFAQRGYLPYEESFWKAL